MNLALALTARYLAQPRRAHTQPTWRAEDAVGDELETRQQPSHAPVNRSPQPASRHTADVPADAIRRGSAA
jgi:hypothetical protein